MLERSIVLTTIVARYHHCAFGLRYLRANLGRWRSGTILREFTPDLGAAEIVQHLVSLAPRLVGFSVHIWNVRQTLEVVRLLREHAPEVVLVIGGPEASYEYEGTELLERVDCLVRGEGEAAFVNVVDRVMEGAPLAEKVVEAPVDLAEIALPYDDYGDEDIAHRTLYVETSRGCPFRCEFCLSSLHRGVREFPLGPFFEAMDRLMGRGARRFKFVDRTFNLRTGRCLEVLHFFRRRWQPGMQLHFEIVPDRLDPELVLAMAEFPPGGLHLEVGVQSFHAPALAAISRSQDAERVLANLQALQQTGAVLHADLLVGLPGEDPSHFAAGFDRLMALRLPEVQLEVLKRLKGAPIQRHASLRFSDTPPYALKQSDWMDEEAVRRLSRFTRFFDLYYNSGNFLRSLEFLWQTSPSMFMAFDALAHHAYVSLGATHSIPLVALAHVLFDHLVARLPNQRAAIAMAIDHDYHRLPGRREHLWFLEERSTEADHQCPG